MVPAKTKTSEFSLKKSALPIAVAMTTLALSTMPLPAAAAKAPAKKPNILYLVADDLGYSDIGAFGGEIHTPNLDALLKEGRILTNYHTSTVCAVTRSMLYSGTDHHLVGEGTMGAPNDERKGLPGYEGYLNDRSLSVAQLLQDAGYHTYIAGKWHLGSDISLRQTPDAWGFEHSYTLLGGAARNHFGHEAADSKNYAADGQYVQPGQPGQPGGDGSVFYDTDFYTQKLIQWIDQGRADGKPFVAFATYTSPHWPLQVPDEYLGKYKGVYDVGYEAIRNQRIKRQKKLGIVPADFTPAPRLPDTPVAPIGTPNNGTPDARYINANNYKDPSYIDYGPGRVNKDWKSLSWDEKKLQSRYMEIYAGMVENLDHNIGLLIQHLKDIGEYENTFIVFHSDNGAEGWPLSDQQQATNLANFDKLGQDYPGTVQNVQYGLRWAEVGATPHKLSKGFTTEGGTRVPTIVHLPGQKHKLPPLRDFAHITDATPTLLALAGVAPPSTPAPILLDDNGVNQNEGKVVYDGRCVYPITGVSLLDELTGKTTGPAHTAPVGEEQYGRAYLHYGDWKALWIEPTWGPTDGHWQLYQRSDQGEVNDVAADNPKIVDYLVKKWQEYMQKVGGVEPLRPRGYY